MDTGQRLRIARVLVLTELVLAATTAFEATVVAVVGMAPPLNPALTLVQIVLLALAARALGRGRVRLARGLQVAILAVAAVDLVIAALVSMPPLLVPVLVRIVLPIAVLVLLRKPREPRTAPVPVLVDAVGVR